MRRFHSYGPVDHEEHFCVERPKAIEDCAAQLVGKPGKPGHYFTIWAPRQTGKTWLMRRVKQKIQAEYGDRFLVASISMQGVVLKEDEPDDHFLSKIPKLMLDGFDLDIDTPANWEDWALLFHKRKGLFDRPVLLFIDEFDSLPPGVIDRLVTLFRDMFQNRESYILHGLALVGVRAVLGSESDRGSPFNVQRSMHLPNFSREETNELFEQYRRESKQTVEPEVVEAVFTATKGQPGLVGWFGELLTEKYNPGAPAPIAMDTWERAYKSALRKEWNNNILNIVKKARGKYRAHVLDLFSRPDIPFSLYAEWTNYLYLNGIIDYGVIKENGKQEKEVCRFSSPFVQACLYGALTGDVVGDRLPILALEPLDDLADVFADDQPDIPALLKRYKDYLARLKAKGLNPWKDQPRRVDLHFTEAVGHFHLYAWLQNAIGRRCVISPEFPTGNGKVDLHIHCETQTALIEVKSFTGASQVKEAQVQAAGYAKQIGLTEVTIALFVPVTDQTVIEKLSTQTQIDNVRVTVIAIGWV